MTCSDCNSEHQHGRFCIRCGRKQPLGRTTLGVRRLPPTRRTDAPSRTDAARTRADESTVRDMYDSALARAGSRGEPSLDRYLSVLLRTSRSA